MLAAVFCGFWFPVSRGNPRVKYAVEPSDLVSATPSRVDLVSVVPHRAVSTVRVQPLRPCLVLAMLCYAMLVLYFKVGYG